MNKDNNKHAKVDAESSQVLNPAENYKKLKAREIIFPRKSRQLINQPKGHLDNIYT